MAVVVGRPQRSPRSPEVLLGIVDGDPESFRSVDPSWTPTLPSRDPSGFTVADLLLAG